jgi:hypothetical protein
VMTGGQSKVPKPPSRSVVLLRAGQQMAELEVSELRRAYAWHSGGIPQSTHYRAGRIFKERTLSELTRPCALNQYATMDRNKEAPAASSKVSQLGAIQGDPTLNRRPLPLTRSVVSQPSGHLYLHLGRAGSALERDRRLRYTTRQRGSASGR